MRPVALTLVLALWCVLLGDGVRRGLTEPVAVPTLDLDGLDADAAAVERVRLEPVPAADHRVVVERPLFSPSRRPPPEATAPAPATAPPAPPPAFRLVGTMRLGARWRALVSVDDRAPVMLAPGETIEGWRVASLERGVAVLEREGRQVTAALDPETLAPAAEPDGPTLAGTPRRAGAPVRPGADAAGERPVVRFVAIDEED